VIDGTQRGLQAIVASVIPGRQRVAVLMDLLGRQTMIELPDASVIKEGDRRAPLLQGQPPRTA
jgi:transcription antitermination factor NusG